MIKLTFNELMSDWQYHEKGDYYSFWISSEIELTLEKLSFQDMAVFNQPDYYLAVYERGKLVEGFKKIPVKVNFED